MSGEDNEDNGVLPSDIPADIWATVDALMTEAIRSGVSAQEAMARAVMAERQRWYPAADYFWRYCRDEAEDAARALLESQLPEWWRGWEELDDDGSLSRLFMLPGNRLLTVNFFPGKDTCVVSYADPDQSKCFAVRVGEGSAPSPLSSEGK